MDGGALTDVLLMQGFACMIVSRLCGTADRPLAPMNKSQITVVTAHDLCRAKSSRSGTRSGTRRTRSPRPRQQSRTSRWTIQCWRSSDSSGEFRCTSPSCRLSFDASLGLLPVRGLALPSTQTFLSGSGI